MATSSVTSGLQQALVSPYLRTDQSSQSSGDTSGGGNKLTKVSSNDSASGTQSGQGRKSGGRGNLVDISV